MCLGHLSGNGIAEASGSILLLLVHECATGTVMIRAEVFIVTLVGGSGGGALGRRSSRWGITTGCRVLKHGLSG